MRDEPFVKHRPLVPFDYGTLKEDAATLYVNNRVFEGFKEITITRPLLSLAGSFQITITDVWKPDQPFGIRPGDRIHCHIGKVAVFEGYVDTFTINITPGSRNFTISGRDRTSDLVDCAVTGSSEFNKLDLQKISEELCRPFGIKVLNPFGVNIGKPFEKFTVRQGETVFEAISRAAKSRQIILLTSTHGNLILDKRGVRRAGTELVEGVNIEVSGANFDNSQRFSDYIVKGQQPGVIGNQKDATQSKGVAKDNAIKRFRPTLVLSEQSSDGDAAQKRAEFEASYRTAKSFKCSGTVTNWRRKDGSIWTVNELVILDAPSIGIRRQELLISNVVYKQSSKGRSVDLELIRKDAFAFEKEKKEDGDILPTIGWT
jgi:prophage tail gpP-like protein